MYRTLIEVESSGREKVMQPEQEGFIEFKVRSNRWVKGETGTMYFWPAPGEALITQSFRVGSVFKVSSGTRISLEPMSGPQTAAIRLADFNDDRLRDSTVYRSRIQMSAKGGIILYAVPVHSRPEWASNTGSAKAMDAQPPTARPGSSAAEGSYADSRPKLTVGPSGKHKQSAASVLTEFWDAVIQGADSKDPGLKSGIDPVFIAENRLSSYQVNVFEGTWKYDVLASDEHSVTMVIYVDPRKPERRHEMTFSVVNRDGKLYISPGGVDSGGYGFITPWRERRSLY